MRKVISVADKVVDGLVNGLAYVAAGILLLITVSISLDVVLRYAVNNPLKWVFEATEYSLLFIAFFATTWVLKRDGHVKLDLLLNALGEKAQAWANACTSLVVAGVCLVTAWSSANYTIYLYRNDVTITKYYTVPQFALMVVIPLGFALLFIQSLKRAYGYFLKTKEPRA